jgi:internalin A
MRRTWFKALTLAWIAILLIIVVHSGGGWTTSPSIAKGTFTDWCRDLSSLAPEAQHTVQVLLDEARTTDCIQANTTLNARTDLILNGKAIADLRPLSSFTQLKTLDLRNNQIRDLQPLSSLTHLVTLKLRQNAIADVAPLSTLTHLRLLNLRSNQLGDLRSLVALKNLKDEMTPKKGVTSGIILGR